MNTTARLKFTLLVLAALALSACGGGAEVALSDAASSSVDAAPPAEDQSSADGAETPAPAEPATDSSAGGAAANTAVITIEGETWTFDLWACPAFGPEFLSASGLPIDPTPAGTEFGLSYELPLPGDDDTAEYDNTVTITIGNDTWKAGTLTNAVGEQSWGELDWVREADSVSGTAMLEQTWGEGFQDSAPRQATFIANCND